MRLRKVFRGIEGLLFKGSKEIEITGICSDSRVVAPGNLFIAKGAGANYILQALEAGALAVLTDMYDPFLKGVCQVIHSDVEKIAPDVASNYFEDPSSKLFMVGITGTNGKTTTGYLLQGILGDAGLLGSVEYILGKNRFLSTLTTPDVVMNQRYLKEMVLSDLKAAVMEVSSHGIAQGRVSNIDFDVAVFTNLTRDHLDYHETFESYRDVKGSFFRSLKKDGYIVLNNDSEHREYMVADVGAKVLTYSVGGEGDFLASNVVCSMDGVEFDLEFEGKKRRVRSKLVGRFNVYNILAAIASSYIYGMDIDTIVERVCSFGSVRGRMERVISKRPFHLFVDYAHSEDSLKNVLLTLNEIKRGDIITVFGCGGERDSGKRANMGEVVSSLSSFSFITNDNPRGEDPKKIIEEIISGFLTKNYAVEPDRYMAIKKAILSAKRDDIVLIAGKGHERNQIFANKTYAFDDREVAKEILEEL